MQFTTQREPLQKAVATAARAVSNRSTLPILSHLLLIADGGVLTVKATDLEIGIACDVPLNPLDPVTAGRTTVPARLFTEVVSAMPAGKAIEVTVDEHDHVTLRCGKSVMEVNGLPADEFPPLPSVGNGVALAIPASTLQRLIKHVEIAISSDETRARLTGMQVKAEGGRLRLVATDTHRLATGSLELSEPCDDVSCIVPGRAMREVARELGGDLVDVLLGESQVQFRFGHGMTLVSRLIEGEFPNWRKVVPTSHAWLLSGPVTALREAVRRVAIVTREDNHKAVFTLSEGRLAMSGQSSKVGSADEEVDGLSVSRAGGDESLQIAFNADYILDALGVIESDDMCMELTAANQPAAIRGDADDDLVVVCMPLQLL